MYAVYLPMRYYITLQMKENSAILMHEVQFGTNLYSTTSFIK